MILISEKLNSSIPSVHKLMDSGDTDSIKKLIENQIEAGSEYLDLNTAIFGSAEWEKMKYVLDIIFEYDCGIMIDTTNPDIAALAAEYTKGKNIILNSVTLTARFDSVVPTAVKYGCGIVGLPMGDDGTPATAKERIEKGIELTAKLKEAGIPEEKIYIDAIAEACAANDKSAKTVADTVKGIREQNDKVHLMCGLSNISFGLPERSCINSGFLNILSYCGMDAAILNPASADMKKAIAASNLLSGNDEYCMDYITAIREMD